MSSLPTIPSIDKTRLLSTLDNLQSQHNISILFAIESGSRAWGFASEDSDFDVRGVFTYSLSAYLQVHDLPSEISYIRKNEQGKIVDDIVLWELKKFLKLLQISNPSIYEWIRSPIIYINLKREDLHLLFEKSEKNEADFNLIRKYQMLQGVHKKEINKEIKKDNWLAYFKELVDQHYDQNFLKYHYLSMFKGNYKTHMLGKIEVSAKKILYILRALACLECLTRKILTAIEFAEVKEYLSENMLKLAERAIKVKIESEGKMMLIEGMVREELNEKSKMKIESEKKKCLLNEEIDDIFIWILCSV